MSRSFDPEILLRGGAGVKLPLPTEQMGRALGLRELMQQSQANDLAMKEAEGKRQREAAIRQVIARHGRLTPMALNEIERIDPQARMALEAALQKRDAETANIASSRAQTAKTEQTTKESADAIRRERLLSLSRQKNESVQRLGYNTWFGQDPNAIPYDEIEARTGMKPSEYMVAQAGGLTLDEEKSATDIASKLGPQEKGYPPGTLIVRTDAQGNEISREQVPFKTDADKKTFQELTYEDFLKDPELTQKYGASRIGFEKWQRETAPRPPVELVIDTDQGPQIVDRRTSTARPIRNTEGNVVQPPKTAEMRNRDAALERIAPIVQSIDELSTLINTQEGVIARISGEAEKAKAMVNLNDDISEYNAVIEGFTPMLARAVGHVGVLTEQDVASVKAAFPKPGDSKAVRDRKMARFKFILYSGQQGQLKDVLKPEESTSPAGDKKRGTYNPATGKVEY